MFRLLLPLAFVALAHSHASAAELAMPGIPARSIGPCTMGGRVTCIAVVENDTNIQYIGAASGGVWKTTDDGKSWTCVFEGRPYATIGALAVSQSNPNVVYAGTGEANARNSVSWGNGVFVSRDAGKTWTHAGLAETHHIGKIVVHPANPDIAYVAALGRLWGPNAERGVFRTADGGKTWEHVLKLDADTGCIDVALDFNEPKTLYTAAYCVRRDGFSGGNPGTQFGPKAGLYRSRDEGKTWTKLSKGLPGVPIGRCGLDVYRKDPKVIFAIVQTDKTDIRQVRGQMPGRGPVEIGGVFRSRDGGDSWEKVNDVCPRPFYFSVVRVDPTDELRLWVLGLPVFASTDGGKTFNANASRGVHVDHHDLWVNPKDSRHLILGNDGGLYYSRDRNQTWLAVKNFCISQFYGVGVDMASPFRVYGGLQDNGSWGGPTQTDNAAGILNGDFRRVLPGDGFQCKVDPTDPNIVYAESQYGRLARIDMRTRRTTTIRPLSPKGEPLRFNWNAPLVLSAHDSKTLYYGANMLCKTTDRGTNWRRISGDLTNGKAGVTYRSTGHTLSAIGESPLEKGVVYTGSDDGRILVTRDDGGKWTELSDKIPGLPKDRWINRLECSPHAKGTVYLAIDRHRNNDTNTYLYRSDDYGQSWKSIVGNLPPDGPVHVIKQDAKNKDILYVGTEQGLYASFDAGTTYQRLGHEMPLVPVHDLVVHPRERELVIGTHGRGIYLLDAAPLQDMTAQIRQSRAHLFAPKAVTPAKLKPATPVPEYTYAGTNPPSGAVVYYYLRERGEATLEITGNDGKLMARLPVSSEPGLHRAVWDLHRPAGKAQLPVPNGEYTVRLTVEGKPLTRPLTVGKVVRAE